MTSPPGRRRVRTVDSAIEGAVVLYATSQRAHLADRVPVRVRLRADERPARPESAYEHYRRLSISPARRESTDTNFPEVRASTEDEEFAWRQVFRGSGVSVVRAGLTTDCAEPTRSPRGASVR